MPNIISNTNTPSTVRFEKRGDTFDIFVSDDSGVERKYIPEQKKGNGKIGIYIEYNPDEIQMKIKTSLSTVPIEYDQIKGKRFEVDLDYFLSFDMFGKEIDLEPFGFSGMRGEIEFYGKHVTSDNGAGYFMGDKLEVQMYNYYLDNYYDILFGLKFAGEEFDKLDHGEGMKILFNKGDIDSIDFNRFNSNVQIMKNVVGALIGGDLKIVIKSKPLETTISLNSELTITTNNDLMENPRFIPNSYEYTYNRYKYLYRPNHDGVSIVMDESSIIQGKEVICAIFAVEFDNFIAGSKITESILKMIQNPHLNEHHNDRKTIQLVHNDPYSGAVYGTGIYKYDSDGYPILSIESSSTSFNSLNKIESTIEAFKQLTGDIHMVEGSNDPSDYIETTIVDDDNEYLRDSNSYNFEVSTYAFSSSDYSYYNQSLLVSYCMDNINEDSKYFFRIEGVDDVENVKILRNGKHFVVTAHDDLHNLKLHVAYTDGNRR